MSMSYKEFVEANKRDDQSNNDITHFFSRYFVNIFAYPLYRIGLTPNQVTLIFIFTGLVGGILSFYNFLISSYILWRIHIIIDMADGSVARVTRRFSSLGDTLDKIGHHLIYPIYWIGFLHASQLLYQYPLFSIIFFAISSSQWTIKHLFKNKEERPKAISVIKRIIANIFGIEGFFLLIIIQVYFDVFDSLYLIIFMTITNFILLTNKAFSLIKNS